MSCLFSGNGPSGPAALMRRASVLRMQNLGGGAIHLLRAFQYMKGFWPHTGGQNQKERHLHWADVFLFGAGKGNRTLIFSLGSRTFKICYPLLHNDLRLYYLFVSTIFSTRAVQKGHSGL